MTNDEKKEQAKKVLMEAARAGMKEMFGSE